MAYGVADGVGEIVKSYKIAFCISFYSFERCIFAFSSGIIRQHISNLNVESTGVFDGNKIDLLITDYTGVHAITFTLPIS